MSASSRRTTPLPAHWASLRRAVMNRDGWMCQHIRYDTGEPCAEPARHCDHIVPASEGGSEGGSDDPANLRALRDWHVLRKDAADAGRARKRAAAERWQPARTRRRHPGEIR
ncbi:HNH endonuclease [Kitasatospora sp. NPDC058048]|uniref:HNH endonuclease n=1 Tax=Kitasatospora sp. NPDC058048 TaxID=3346313 RepID=UPI0036DBD5BD